MILKAERFPFHDKLIEYVAKNNIQREDILIITETPMHITLFYYALA